MPSTRIVARSVFATAVFGVAMLAVSGCTALGGGQAGADRVADGVRDAGYDVLWASPGTDGFAHRLSLGIIVDAAPSTEELSLILTVADDAGGSQWAYVQYTFTDTDADDAEYFDACPALAELGVDRRCDRFGFIVDGPDLEVVREWGEG